MGEIQVQQATPAEIHSLLRGEGRIVRVRFLKKDHSIRELVGRTGVKKGVTGGGRRYDFNEHGIVLLWDFALAAKGEPASKCYRAVKIDSVLEITADGIKYHFRDDPAPKPEPVAVERPDHGELCFCVQCGH